MLFTAKKPRVRKDPTAQTEFLPDPERDAQRLREIEQQLYEEQLKQEKQKGANAVLLDCSCCCLTFLSLLLFSSIDRSSCELLRW